MFRPLSRWLVLACGLGLAAPQDGAAQPRPDLQVGGALDLPLPPFQAVRQIRSDLLNVVATLRGIEGLSLGVDETGWIGFGWRTEAGDRAWLTGLAWDRLAPPGPAAGKLSGVLDLTPDEVLLALGGVHAADLIRLGGSGRHWQIGLAARAETTIDLGVVDLAGGARLVEVADASLTLPLSLGLGPLGLRAELMQMEWGTDTPLALAPDPDSLEVWYEAPLAERVIAGLGVDAGAGARLSAEDDAELHTSVMLSHAFERIGAAISAPAGLDLRPPEGLWGMPEGSLRIAAAAGAPLGTGRRLHLGFEYLHRDLLGPEGIADRGFTLRLVL